ncbi:MAG: hypothetical protein WAN36_11610, partial [Calditrichia bacterium]
MDFSNALFLPPSVDHLHLIKYILLLLYFIHLPFISLLIGGTFFSLFFRVLAKTHGEPNQERIAKDFVETLVFNKWAGIFLGVLPLAVLTLAQGQVFYDAPIHVVQFLTYATALIAVGITLIYFYQYTYRNSNISFLVQLGSGGTGLLFLLLGYFIFHATLSLTLDPGRWYLVTSVTGLLYSWNVVARFIHFLTAAFAVSGVALLFFTFNWKETRRYLDPNYTVYMKKVGGGIALAFVLFQPLLLLWNLITIPTMALSVGVYALSVFVLFLVLLLSLAIYRFLSGGALSMGSGLFAMFIIIF